MTEWLEHVCTAIDVLLIVLTPLLYQQPLILLSIGEMLSTSLAKPNDRNKVSAARICILIPFV